SSSGFLRLPRYSALWPHPFGVSASAVQKRLAVFVLKLELFRVWNGGLLFCSYFLFLLLLFIPKQGSCA
ncbi:hypothetical protein, partial [Pectobacterium versatile]|uniref:hypothetical protein n=1 Tax=Pectobacterium versatile TaxID=2488639 RepID=UPI0030170264